MHPRYEDRPNFKSPKASPDIFLWLLLLFVAAGGIGVLLTYAAMGA